VLLLLASTSLLAGGCTFLPSSGPSDYRIRKEAGRLAADGASYQLLPVNAATIEALRRLSPKPSYVAAGGRDVMNLFRSRGVEALGQGSAQAIQPGDVVHVAIFEAGGGLFQPMSVDGRGGGTPVTSLPAQPIDQRGEITVPYAGRVRALGRLPSDLEKEITELLTGKTVDPQVIVTVMKREGGNLVSVGGDVKQSRQVPVTLAGTRLIDAITAAGGPTARPHEVMVTVTRDGVTRSDTLQSIFDSPGKNILLQPTDTILLRNVSISYMVFGAGGAVGSVPIEVEDLTLAQAMARTGGANDMRANPAAVFIYREENRKVLEAVGQGDQLPPGSGPVPVIYQLQLQDPEGFFYASNFSVRDQDIVYYANATSVGVGKFMGLLNTLLSPVSSVAGGAATVRVLSPGSF
jgi:polysaccharide export outer membrane protein